MPRPIDPSRDLLFGLLALQTGLINQAQLVAAFHAWSEARQGSMAEILAEHGALDTACLTLVEGLVIEHLRRHGSDPQQSLAALAVGRSARDCLAQIANPELDDSLVHVGSDATEDYHNNDRTASYAVGTTTSDGQRFRLIRPHAQGGLGAVFVALDTELHREVALKQILDDHADDPISRQRFLLEAEITGGLEHPGIVPVYGLGTYGDGRPYYAMRFIRGDSLKEAIERFHADRALPIDPGRRSLELRKLLRRFLDVCNAIDYAHSRGVLHRDIKPGNVLLGQHGETMMVDWGLAKSTGRPDPGSGERTLRPRAAGGSMETLPGRAMGTLAYMSPEQAEGDLDRLGPRSDVYSLGATLYDLLTGTPPLVGAPGEVLRAVQRGEFQPPRAIDPSIDRALEAVCLKAMALRPDDRYGCCRGLAEDIERWMADEPVSVWREPRSRRARRWARRHGPAVTGAAVALLALLIGVAAAATVYLQQRQVQVSRLALALREANLLRGQAQADPEGDVVKWHAALQSAQRAEDLLGPLIDTASKRQVRELGDQVAAATRAAERDARLLREAVDIRSAEADDPDGSGSDAAYARAFHDAEIDPEKQGAELAGAKIKGRPAGVALALTAALDDWAAQRRKARPMDTVAWKRLVATARAADPDESRDRLRELWSQPDRRAQSQRLLQLANEADPRGWPPASLTLLAGALDDAGMREAATELLGRAQAERPGDVWINYNLARLLEQLHPPRTEEAIRFYSVARALRPETAHGLAHLLEGRGRDDEAAVVFRDLTQMRSENGRHWGCLGKLLQRRGDPGATAALAKGVEALREAVRLKPDFAEARQSLASALIGQGKPSEAVAALREAIRLKPDLGEAHTNLGVALSAEGKLPEAIATYREAIRLKPDDALAHDNLGNALRTLGKLSEATAAWREAIRLKPDFAQAHQSLGAALANQGKTAEGIAACREAIRLRPDLAEAHVNLGAILCDVEHDFKGAEAEFREAIRLRPHDAKAHTNLGNALIAQRKLDEALAAWREAIRLDPDLAEAHVNLGNVLAARGKLAEAIAAFREAIRLKPDLAMAHINLGNALRAQGRLAEAMAAWREAIRLRPNLAEAHNNLGAALRVQGKPAEAMAAWREAIRLKPDDAAAHCNLGSALQDQGQFSEALDELRRGHELGSKRPGWPFPSAEWVRQAERLVALERRLPAVIRGDDKSKDAAERIEFADLAYRTKRFAPSARLYAELLRGDPKLAVDIKTEYRYKAACAAALAGADQGQDEPPLDEPEKARWRKQGLDWLRADLAIQTKQAETGNPGATDLVSQKLEHWKADPDLGAIRDETAIKALPDDERKACRALWAEVDALLARARAGTAPRPHR
jgi:tetratricopeptide (TPR) repeat protein/tRNA A-37 threonylcarbamoyl transferase component Bud32